jgi:DNA-binding MarR family transcriptional regulator
MSTDKSPDSATPLQIGALLRFALAEVRERIYEGVVTAGYDDIRPSHVTLFRWPGPQGRRPTEIAASVQFSKQRVNDLLRDLESLGYLALVADPSDDRARLVRLTERGRKLHETAIGIHAATEEEWSRQIGAERYREMCEALRDLVIHPDQTDPLTRRASRRHAR